MTVLLPAWLQNATYSAELDRAVPTALLSPSSALGAVGGVRRWAGNELQVVPMSPAAMQVVVKAGLAWVSGEYTSVQGAYVVINDDDVTLTVATASSSGSRIDLVVLEVLDSVYSGSNNLAQLRVVTGTPSATPAAPVVGGAYIVLAQILVAQSATSISTSAIVDTRTYSAANGGILPVRDATARLLLVGVPIGMPVLEISTRRVYTYTGSGWDYAFGGTPPTQSISLASGWYNWTTRNSGGPWEDLRVTKTNGIVFVNGLIGNQFSFTNPGTMFQLPVGFRPERRKVIRVQTGSNAERRVDIYPDGFVRAWPGVDGRTHAANDWWSIEIVMPIVNNTVG